MLKYKVYFKEETGIIQAISNIDQDFDNFYEADYEDVAKYIDGGLSMSLSKVVYNINTSEYNIIPKDQKLELLVDDLIFKVTPRSNYQLGIWKDNNKNCWSVNLSQTVKQDLKNVKSRQNQKLTFSVTQHNNPNILHRYFSCMLNDLIENPTVDIDFLSQDEEELTNFSVYTNRKFEKYTCGVING